MVETLIAAAMVALAEAQATLRVVKSPDPRRALEAVAAAMAEAEELHLQAVVMHLAPDDASVPDRP